MTNSIRIVGMIASTFVIAACATTSPNAKPQTVASLAQDPTCLTKTGSLLPDKGGCAGHGWSYSKDDMDHVGATTASQALSYLAPSVTVSR